MVYGRAVEGYGHIVGGNQFNSDDNKTNTRVYYRDNEFGLYTAGNVII